VSLQKDCQICNGCQHARVIYGPFENRQPSVRAKPAPILKAIPGMTGTTRKRKPFEPTHLELPPIGSIYVLLDKDCQTHGNVPYVVRLERPIIDNGLLLIVPVPPHGRAGDHWWNKLILPSLEGAYLHRSAGRHRYDTIQVGQPNDKAALA
jgi:hypothetical protein